MKFRHFTAFIFVLFIANFAQAEKAEGVRGSAFGEDHAFSMKAPKGWIIDSESAARSGVGLVFYPVGSNWRDSEAVLYVRARQKDNTIKSETDVIQDTVSDFRANGSPNYKVEKTETIKITQNQSATVAFYAGDQWGNLEVAGYINESETINFLVLNARNKSAFEKALPIFYEILKSYQPGMSCSPSSNTSINPTAGSGPSRFRISASAAAGYLQR